MKKIVFLLFILCSTLTVNAQFIVSVLQQHQKLIILAILLLNTKMFMVEPSESRLQKKQTTLVIRKQSKKVTISIQPFGHGNIDKKNDYIRSHFFILNQSYSKIWFYQKSSKS